MENATSEEYEIDEEIIYISADNKVSLTDYIEK